MNIYRSKPSGHTKFFIGITIGVTLYLIAFGASKDHLESCLPAALFFPVMMLPIAYVISRQERCAALTSSSIRILRAHNSLVELEFSLSNIELIVFEKVSYSGYRMGIKIGREMNVHDLLALDTPQAARLMKDLEMQGTQVILSD